MTFVRVQGEPRLYYQETDGESPIVSVNLRTHQVTQIKSAFADRISSNLSHFNWLGRTLLVWGTYGGQLRMADAGSDTLAAKFQMARKEIDHIFTFADGASVKALLMAKRKRPLIVELNPL